MNLMELTYRDLRANARSDGGFLHQDDRVRELRARGTRFAGMRGYSVFFRTFSSEYDTNSTLYTQEIRLIDLPAILRDKTQKLSARVKKAMAGDVAIRCTCPAFRYWGFAYILTQLGAKVTRPENRFPRIRNPDLRNVMCKHLRLVMDVFGSHWNSVLSELMSRGVK